MKKLILALACVYLSSTSFANKTIRIINADSQDLQVSLESCVKIWNKSTGGFSEACDKTEEVKLLAMKNDGSKGHYTDKTIASDYEDEVAMYTPYLHVLAVKGLTTGAFSKYSSGSKNCAVMNDGNIVLNSFYTDHVLCDDNATSGENS